MFRTHRLLPSSLNFVLVVTPTISYYKSMKKEESNEPKKTTLDRETIILEDRLWYRFLKVVYFLFLILVITSASLAVLISKPYSTVDYARITCSDGRVFNTDTMDLYLYSEYISTYNDEKIKMWCDSDSDGRIRVREKITGQTGTIPVESFNSIRYERIGRQSVTPNYTPEFIYKIEGSWQTAFWWFVGIVFIGFILTEVIKRTLLYIIAGKRFLN